MHETQTSEIEHFQAYRSLLFSIAYRMLGSVMDAEDCVAGSAKADLRSFPPGLTKGQHG
nr:sigma factor [Ktedonosporobacter rubrisoli]